MTGEARALSEGKIEVMLSNHVNAASLVYVNKVKHAEIDDKYRKNLAINTDNGVSDLRVRIKLFLGD